MIDLVQEEQRLSAELGMSMEDVLGVLDQATPCQLGELYATACDRYLVLAGKGKRTEDQTMELDRLDSALQQLFGPSGVMVVAANLLKVISVAQVGTSSFLQDKSTEKLAQTQLSLEVAAEICWTKLQNTLVPFDAPRTADLAHRASQLAAVLVDTQTEPAWHFWNWNRRSGFCLSRLLSLLVGRQTGTSAWLAAEQVFNPQELSAHQLLERVQLCCRLAGVTGCTEVVLNSQCAIRELAELLAKDLSARSEPTGRITRRSSTC